MAIKPKANGKWQVDVQKKGRERYRATYDTKLEAQEAERCYLGGLVLPNVTSKGIVTLKDLYNAACREVWTEGTSKPRANAEWGLSAYFGWERDASTVTALTMSEYKHFCRTEHGNGENTINKKVSAFNVMFKHGYDQGLINSPLKTPFKKLKKNGRIRVLTDTVESLLITFIGDTFGPEWRDYMTILVETGMRTQEAGKLKWQDVNLKQGMVTIWEAKGDARIVPLTGRAKEAIESLKGLDTVLVFPSFSQRILNYTIWNCVRTQFNDYSRDFVPHCLRHTAATRMIQAGVPPFTVQKWMGHKSIQTTMGYVHFDMQQYEDAVEIMNNRKVTRDMSHDMSHTQPHTAH